MAPNDATGKSTAPPRPTSGAGADTNQPGKQPAGPPGAGQQMDPRIVQQQRVVQQRLKDIDRILVVMSGKGGVGKSSVAASLAVKLAEQGKQVGLLDMDLTGPDLPKFMGVEKAEIGGGEKGMTPVRPRENLKLMSLAYLLPDPNQAVVWRGPMKMGAIRQLITEVDWGRLDYLVIDLPPGTSDEPLSIAQSVPDVDGVVIVTTPHSVSILDVRKSISFARQLGLHVLGLIENMSGLACPHCDKEIPLFGKGLGKDLAEEVGIGFLGAVPIDPEAASDSGRASVPAMIRPGSPASAAFDGVVEHIVKAVQARPARKRPSPGTGPLKMA